MTQNCCPSNPGIWSRVHAVQAARLLALLAAVPAPEQLLERRWMPFIRAALASDDCKLSSHAARALLNLMSARAARYSSQHNRIGATADAASKWLCTSPRPGTEIAYTGGLGDQNLLPFTLNYELRFRLEVYYEYVCSPCSQ